MWDLKACTVCLSTDVKFYNMNSGLLRQEFNVVSGLETYHGDGTPEYLCVECSAYVKRFIKFRDKCQRANYALHEILEKNKQIKKSYLKLIDRKEIGVMPTLSYVDLNKLHYDEVKFQWVKYNRLSVTSGDLIPTFHYSTLNEAEVFDVPKKRKLTTETYKEQEEIKLETDLNNDVNISLPDYVNNKEPDLLEQALSNVEDVDMNDGDNYFHNYQSDNDNQEFEGLVNEELKVEQVEDVDGSNLEEEYARIYPITINEARAAMEVYKLFGQGKHKCHMCNKAYYNEDRLKIHMRMHDTHVSGSFLCELCNYYYKTEFLLKTHMTEKHMYKYVCKKCPEVNFDRISAKQHFIWTHLQKGSKKNSNWYESRPTWLSTKGGKRVKGVVSLKPVRKIKKLPDDFPVYSPLTHEEQYQLVRDRQKTRNYIEALYKCEQCYRGFREVGTYNKHMRKHDPTFAGTLQCDMCKLYFRDTRRLYKHMNISHLFKYSCQECSYVCHSRGQAQMHYRWHKNVTYSCPHCNREFKKVSTRLTHIRIKHPSTYICNLCGHSFVSETGLYCHKKIAHSREEIEISNTTPVNTQDPYYCQECNIHFLTQAAFTTHLGSSMKHSTTNLSIKPGKKKSGEQRKRGRPRVGSEVLNTGVPTPTYCDVENCGERLENDVQARKHYESLHPGAEFLKRYMCDVCGHTTKQYANLTVHMRTHTNEKPYECPHCDRRFSMPSNRDRHLVVHTGEKRYQCQHCNRRFTQSSAVKLHIQTVHLKIPYAPWDKKNRKRRKELESTSAIIPPPQPKLLLEPHGDYLNAYITYNDE